MPLYEYFCKKCEQVNEIIKRFSDTTEEKCEKCSSPMEKLISKTSFQLKGSGWYVTDYKKGASAPSNTTKETSKPSTSSEKKSSS